MLFSLPHLQVKLFASCLPHFWLSNLFHSVMSESLRLWRRTNFAADLRLGSSGIGRSWPIQRPFRIGSKSPPPRKASMARSGAPAESKILGSRWTHPSASRPAIEPALAAAFGRRPFIVRFCSFGPGCFAWAEIPSISRASMGRPAIPKIQRHRENEPRFIRGGGHVNPSAMCLRDLRGDMQAKA
jgi:hypothetical protein